MAEKELAKLDVQSDDMLRNIKTFQDALDVVNAAGVAVTDATEELGTGFHVLNKEEKDALIETPFFILGWRENVGDQGLFASVFVVTEDNRKFIINDGSTGVYAQLMKWRDEQGISQGIIVREGLRRSDYDKELPDGKVVEASTYYLNV